MGANVVDAKQALDVAARYTAATNAGDVDALRALHAPDAVVWHNYDEVELPLERSLAVLGWLRRVAPDARFDDIRHNATADGFVQRSVLHATAPEGSRLHAPSCVVVTLAEDGRIVRVEEYLDPTPLAALSTRERPR